MAAPANAVGRADGADRYPVRREIVKHRGGTSAGRPGSRR